jgi:hypothetical protein
MTAAPHSPLVDQVARVLCRWRNGKKVAFPDFEALSVAEKAAYRDQAQAAVAACQFDEMRNAIQVNDALIRDIRHRDARWHDDEMVNEVLERNRVLLAKLDGQPAEGGV